MATGDKLFLATQSDVQEVGSKVDVVDTTTKDTNTKVISLTSKSDEINTTVTNNNTLIQDIKTNTLSVGAKVDNVSTNVDTVISKLDNVGSSKWYYSGKTGATKTLIRKEEMYNGTLESASTLAKNYGYVVGYFVPKVSGLHKITFHGGTTRSNENALLSIGTTQDFLNAANLWNNRETIRTIEDTTYGYGIFTDNIVESIEAYLLGDTSTSRRIIYGRAVIDKMRALTLNTAYSVTSSPLAEWTGLFEANVPVLFFAASDETVGINFKLFDVTVTYNLTEPYEQ